MLSIKYIVWGIIETLTESFIKPLKILENFPGEKSEIKL